jgi:hypothetical protein
VITGTSRLPGVCTVLEAWDGRSAKRRVIYYSRQIYLCCLLGRMMNYEFIYLFIEMRSLYRRLCPSCSGPQPNITISKNAILLLHRLYSCNIKLTLSFYIPTYTLINFLSIFTSYKYSHIFPNSTHQYSSWFSYATSSLIISYFLLKKLLRLLSPHETF